jgi:hypothetical protein
VDFVDDVVDASKEGSPSVDLAQRVLLLETKVLGLEAKLSVLEKKSIEPTTTGVAKQPNITIYGTSGRKH